MSLQAQDFNGFKSYLGGNPTVLTYTDTDGQTYEFIMDATTDINTNMQSKVTRFPVESGANVTDHIINNPLTLNLEGIISESPTSTITTLLGGLLTGLGGEFLNEQFYNKFELGGVASTYTTAALAAGIGFASRDLQSLFDKDLVGKINGLLGNRNSKDIEYPKAAMKGLKLMQETGSLISVRTYFQNDMYTNMVITRSNFIQNANLGGSLKFSLTLQQIDYVSFTAGLVDKSLNTASELTARAPAGSSLTDKVAEGKKAVTETTAEAVKEKSGSFLTDGFGFTLPEYGPSLQ